jgi:hypothetical protein
MHKYSDHHADVSRGAKILLETAIPGKQGLLLYDIVDCGLRVTAGWPFNLLRVKSS